MGAEALPAIFAGFRARNPGIAIELAVTNRNRISPAATPTSRSG